MYLNAVRRLLLLLLGAIFIVLSGETVVAQRITGGGYGTQGPANPFDNPDSGDQGDKAAGDKADTTERKPKKPLESYFFDDSVRKQSLTAWNVDQYKNNINFVDLDTSLYLHQIDYEFLRNGVGDAYLGHLGGASVPLNYFDRPQYRNFSFTNAYSAYLMRPDNVKFFNTKRAFTHLNYLSAGKTSQMEENFAVTHAQNASPSTGFNLDYKSRGTRGIYEWQRTRDKSLSMAVSHTGKKYTMHGGYIYNSIDLKENGGVLNDKHITDTVFELPKNVPVRLYDARNKMKNNAYYLVQSYGVPLKKLTDEDFSIAGHSSLFVGHSIEYNRFHKIYSDSKQQSGEYYKDWFINSDITRDSISESLLSNKLFLQIQPWDRNGVVGLIDAGAGLDNHHYYQFNLNQYLSGNNKGVNKTSFYVYGAIEGQFKKYFNWEGDLRYHPTGSRSQDLNVGGRASISAFLKGQPISLSGAFRYELRSPSYWSENFYSNHFVWFNSFDKENETRIELSLKVPSFNMELSAHQSVISNKIYYDADSRPEQYGGNVSVSGIYAHKDFLLGGLHLNNRVLLQWSTDQDVVPVPLASAFLSYYFEFDVVKDVLRLQMGLDGRYNTKYYAFGYNPATAEFYNQREKEIGGYPMVDAFVNAKWKRMRILVKFQHLNDDLFGDRNYFTVLHYPQNKRILKLGFSWAFYD